jgi:hypothetical protein
MRKASIYRCSQPDLYVACRYGWGLCSKHLGHFTAFKAKYTAAYIEEQMIAIEKAELLPDADGRYADYDLIKRKYTVCLSLTMQKFDFLLGYIVDAFEPDKKDLMYRLCGRTFYEKAQKGHWSTVLALLNAAIPFAEKYKDTLESSYKTPSVKNNMPPDFIAEFKALEAELISLNDACNASEESGQEGTSEKIKANNAIYNALMEMCADGIRVFKNESEMADEFTFTHILNKTRGVRPAGIFGNITEKESGKPIEGVVVTIKNTDRTSTSNKTGRYEIAPLAAGIYVAVIEMVGYQPVVSGELVVKTGKLTRWSVVLEPVLVAQPV